MRSVHYSREENELQNENRQKIAVRHAGMYGHGEEGKAGGEGLVLCSKIMLAQR